MNDRLSTIVYPEKPDMHMITVKKIDNRVFDDSYEFRKKGIFHKIISALVYLFLWLVAAPLVWLLIGARVKGRRKLRRNRKLFKDGCVAVSNHIHFWDSLVILGALHHKVYYPAWEENLRGVNRFGIKLSGGMPVSTNRYGLRKLERTFNELLADSKWVFFFPEGAMWWYHDELRPFKKGAFRLAVRNNVPVQPLAFSYRKPTGLYRLFGRKDPLVTLNIGDALFPASEEEMPDENERIEDLRIRTFEACRSLGNLGVWKPVLDNAEI